MSGRNYSRGACVIPEDLLGLYRTVGHDDPSAVEAMSKRDLFSATQPDVPPQFGILSVFGD